MDIEFQIKVISRIHFVSCPNPNLADLETEKYVKVEYLAKFEGKIQIHCCY